MDNSFESVFLTQMGTRKIDAIQPLYIYQSKILYTNLQKGSKNPTSYIRFPTSKSFSYKQIKPTAFFCEGHIKAGIDVFLRKEQEF